MHELNLRPMMHRTCPLELFIYPAHVSNPIKNIHKLSLKIALYENLPGIQAILKQKGRM